MLETKLIFFFSKFQCFNLDICTMDQDDKWTKYRSVLENHTGLLAKKEQWQEPFLCFYEEPTGGKYKPETGHNPPIVIMEKMTSFGRFMVWFGLPMTGICLCWFGIVFACLWYSIPDRRRSPRPYHDPEAMKDALSPFSGAEGLEVGKFPTSGPAACGAGYG